MNLRRCLRWGRAAGFSALGMQRRELARLDGSRAAILMYHRVLPPERADRDAVLDGMYVAPDTFARHLDWLSDEFRVLPLREIATRIEAGDPLPPGACALTFDDGWRDNLENALPALEARGLPATIFVVTERVGTEGAFWPEEVCRRLSALPPAERAEIARPYGSPSSGDVIDAVVFYLMGLPAPEREEQLTRLRENTPAEAPRPRELLDWNELERMDLAGFEVAAHGATHAILDQVPEHEAESELRRARQQLLERGFRGADLLAYPAGGYNPRVRQMAHEAGYHAAVTTELGLAAHGDLLALPRVGLHEDVSQSRVEFRYRVPGRS